MTASSSGFARRGLFAAGGNKRKQAAGAEAFPEATVGDGIPGFVIHQQRGRVGRVLESRAATAAGPFFQRIERAPPLFEPGAVIPERHIKERQKGEVVAQGHTGQKTVPLAKLFAQRAIDAAVVLEFPHLQFRLVYLHISKHDMSFHLTADVYSIIQYGEKQYMKDL